MRISDWSSDVCSSDLRWHAAGLKLHVYSSGSVEAQKLIFGHSVYGDLTPWFSGFFDTDIGGKLEAGSYTRIAVAIGLMPRSILYLSDNPEEVAAAGRAGMQTIRLMRRSEEHTSELQTLMRISYAVLC